MMKMWKRHNFRWGVDYRNEQLDSRTNSNARGSFVFTGLYTGGGTSNLDGADLADFLLGYSQQATIQYGPGLEQFRSWSFNAFFQDDWRVRNNFTLNIGVRYEFQAPYSEASDRLINLDVNSDFTAAVPVQAGEVGPYTGLYPVTILESDVNNVSPRLGVAWRVNPKTVVRGGYGINYSSVPYASVVQKLAAQPPFAETDTRMGTIVQPLPLAAAFSGPTNATTTNNYGVDRNYRIGYVHLWNVDVQRELSRTLSAGVAYTGTKGLSLDLLRAPNRSPTGTTISGVAPFIWQSSDANSTMHSLSARLRKRLAQGLTLGGTYTYGKSMDNASSLGGGGGVVAQNDKDLAAEWSRSSFDVRHRFSGDFSLELPFGQGRRWINQRGVAQLRRRRLDDERHDLGRVGAAVHAARHGRRDGRRERRQRHAAGGLQRRAHRDRRPDDAAVLQHRRVQHPAGRGVRERGPEHHHGSRLLHVQHGAQQELRRARHARRQPAGAGQQRAEHAGVGVDRDHGELADLRPGHVDPLDAVGAVRAEDELLTWLSIPADRPACSWASP